MEAAVAEVRACGGLSVIARAVLAFSNRLRLAGSLAAGAEGNAAQLQVLQRRAVAAYDVARLPQLLDTRTLLGGGTKLSHVLVAMCGTPTLRCCVCACACARERVRWGYCFLYVCMSALSRIHICWEIDHSEIWDCTRHSSCVLRRTCGVRYFSMGALAVAGSERR